jgi:hypothetical protein
MASALYKRYVISTVAYGVVGTLALIGAAVMAVERRWFIAVILLVMFGVCLDNFFCGDRCRVAGGKAKGEYTVPPFLRKT